MYCQGRVILQTLRAYVFFVYFRLCYCSGPRALQMSEAGGCFLSVLRNLRPGSHVVRKSAVACVACVYFPLPMPIAVHEG